MTNQSQPQNNVEPREPRGHFKKFAAIFLAILVVAIGSAIGLRAYEFKRGERGVGELAEALKRAEQEDYQRAMADTYGGKTPQETLHLYIEAVEKGDYELASKYFIGDYQQKELESLRNSPRENIENVISLLKQTVKNEGSFSSDKSVYVIPKPLLVDFNLYPNCIWKIIEI